MIPLKDNWRLPFSFTELWRNLNRMARWLNGLIVIGGTVEHNDNGIVITVDGGDQKFPYRVERVSDMVVSVRSGYWRRGIWDLPPQVGVTDSYVVTPESKWTVNLATGAGQNFVYAKLVHSGTGDTGLELTGGCYVAVGCSDVYPPTADTDVTNPDYGSDLWGQNRRIRLLAVVTAVSSKIIDIWQCQHGDVEDFDPVEFDGDTRHTNTSTQTPIRKTLQRNPDGTIHIGESQLYGIASCEKGAADGFPTASIPYFDMDYLGSGILAWAALDARRMVDATGPRFNSVDILGDPSTVQIHGFDAATAPETTPSDANTYVLIRFTKADGTIHVRYVLRSTMIGPAGPSEYSDNQWSETSFNNWWADWGASVITELDAEYWQLGGTYATCYGGSIGSAVDSLAIDLTGRQLVGSDGTTPTFDFATIAPTITDTTETVTALPTLTGTYASDYAATEITINDLTAAVGELQTKMDTLLATMRTRLVIAT